ncbi:hypothetical protein [Streptomyces sp. NPDC001348]
MAGVALVGVVHDQSAAVHQEEGLPHRGVAVAGYRLAAGGDVGTGNSTVSGYRTDRRNRLAPTNEAGIAAAPSGKSQGVIDLAVTMDGRFVYVQNATSGTIDGFRVGRNGALTKGTTATGLPAFARSGMEGLAAT